MAASVDSPVREPALISTGTVSLRADDVADTRFDVQKVADRYQGRITDSETRTDEDGEVRDARLVLRVPAAEFTEAMDELEKVADLESSTSATDDVTTQVVDTAVRIRVQRASIARIEELLQRAGSIRDVVAVESQLTKRQERLNSLLRQQAYLGDQTSMSTITVHVQRTRAAKATEPEDEAGFLAGLRAGWDGLTTVTLALATVTGRCCRSPWSRCCSGCRVVACCAPSYAAAAGRRAAAQPALERVGLHELGEPRELVGVGRRDHAVPEVEDVTARGPAGLDDGAGPGGHHVGRREDQRRVEVALHRALADHRDRPLQRGAPVDADDVGPGLGHQVEQVGWCRPRSGCAARPGCRPARAPRWSAAATCSV